MSDIVDRAQAREAEILEDALARVAARMPRGPAAIYCRDCGTDIPRERRLAVPGCELCVDCQDHLERRTRRA